MVQEVRKHLQVVFIISAAVALMLVSSATIFTSRVSAATTGKLTTATKVTTNGNVFTNLHISVQCGSAYYAEKVTDSTGSVNFLPPLNKSCTTWAVKTAQDATYNYTCLEATVVAADRCGFNFTLTSTTTKTLTFRYSAALRNTPPPPPSAPAILSPGQCLYPGQYIQSPSGTYSLWLQSDGNLVIYSPYRAIWATYAYGAVACMQGDGVFAEYNANWQPIWYTPTAGRDVSGLFMQDDGNLVIYNAAMTGAWWWSGTQGVL